MDEEKNSVVGYSVSFDVLSGFASSDWCTQAKAVFLQ